MEGIFGDRRSPLIKGLKGTFIFKLIPEPSFIVLLKRLVLIYFLFGLCRLGFYFFNTFLFQGVTVGKVIRFMAAGLKFDTVAILYTNVLYILFCIFPFPWKYNRISRIIFDAVFIITNSIALLANVADFIYFRFTLRRTTMTLFREFSHETNLGKLSFRFIFDYWPATLFFLGLLAILIYGVRRTRMPDRYREPLISYFMKGLVVMALSVGLFIGGVRGGFRHSTRPITLSNAGEYVDEPKETHIVLNTPFCLYKTIGIQDFEKVHFFASEDSLEAIYNPVKHPVPDGPFVPHNVVVFILESFGTENFGFFNKDLENGKYRGYTPFMDSLCQHSLVFRVSYANGRKSIDALPSVLSSIPHVREPYIVTQYYDNKINSLGSLLKEKGYYTAFFHGAPDGSMGFSSFTRLAGFDHYYGMSEYGKNADFDGTWGIWDEPFFQFFRQKLGSFPEPFLGVIFSVSSHHPFELPAKYADKFPTGPHPIHRTIGYTDYALKQFFAEACKEPWFRNTLFVFTADHTQTTPTHPEYLTSAGLFRVPVIFYMPWADSGSVSNELIQQIDIMPTVLGMLHYDKPYFAFGFDVFHEPGHFVVNYHSGVFQIFQGDYMLQFNGKSTTGLYDLRHDPLLNHNLAETEKDTRTRLEIFAKAFMQQYMNRMIENRMTVPEEK